MTDFILLGSHDERLIRRLLNAIPGLEESPEYLALDASDKRLPYIVAARAKEYWERLERDEERCGQGPTLNVLSNGLESLAGDPDEALQDLVIEMLNDLGSKSALADRMRMRLGPKARALYEKFIKS